MKKKRYVSRILCLLILVFCLTSCTSIVQEEQPETLAPTKEENVQANVVAGSGPLEETTPTQESASPVSPSDSFEERQNTVEPEVKMVAYEGEPFVKSVLAVGSNYIYLCGLDEEEKYFLAGMKAEDATFQKYNIDMPENMRVFRMAVDNEGRCHSL